MLLNFLSVLSVLLASRIWYVDRMATRLCRIRKSPMRPILHIIIDSGVIYSLTLVVGLICFVNRSNGQFVILDMVSPSYLARETEERCTETLLLDLTDHAHHLHHILYGHHPSRVDHSGQPYTKYMHVQGGRCRHRTTARREFPNHDTDREHSRRLLT